jgi:hypothetical protein
MNLRLDYSRVHSGLLIPVLGLATFANAQTFSTPIRDGDAVGGGGLVTTIDDCKVNDNGTWLVRCDTDAATTSDLCVVVNGVTLAREADALVAPTTAILSSYGQAFLDDSDRVTWNLFMSTSTPDSGIFRGVSSILPETTISIAPQFGGVTPYTGFFGARNDGANRLLVMASVDDPSIASTTDRALVVLTVDGSGNLLSESVIVKEGDLLGTPGDAMVDLETDRFGWDFNRNGQALYTADTSAATSIDGMLMLDTTVLVREGSPSPIALRNWSVILGRQCGLNDNGDYAFRGGLDAPTTDDDVICKNNTTVIAREGSSLASIGGVFTFTSFGTSATVDIDNSGNVFWYGDWNDPVTTQDTGIFRNGDLIIQKGVTQVGGLTVTGISAVQDNFSISPNGRYLIVDCTLTGSIDVALLVDFGPPATTPVAFCFGDGTLTDHTTPCPCGNNGAPGNGCGHSFDPNGANLASTGTTTADDIVLHSSFEPVSSFTLFMQHANAGDTVFHDGVLCAGNPLIRLRGRPAVAGEAFFPNSNFAQDSTTTLSIRGGTFPGSGSTMRYAAWYRNASSTFCPPATANVTNGLVVTW